METILSRIQQIADNEKSSIGALERKIGASKGVLSRAIANGTDIQAKWLPLLVENYPQYSIEWLVTGNGSMIKTLEKAPLKSVKKAIEAHKDIVITDPATVITPVKNFKKLGCPYYNVDFAAGFDSMFNDQTSRPDYYIDFAPYNKKNAVWCNVSGHSMSPEISNGDIILIRQLPDWQCCLVFGEVYGIITDNSLRTVKRVRKGSSDANFLLIPTNKEYDQQEIAKTHITSVFEVLCSVKKF